VLRSVEIVPVPATVSSAVEDVGSFEAAVKEERADAVGACS